ncbi:MAG: STN domain-containing protein [Steroidobacteraceae bacterium]
MMPANKVRIHLVGFTAFVASFAWLATARADDVLDRGVRFQIAASPLSSALIEFSAQSGIQVAVADADVAHLHASGVNGVYPIREALQILLRGTGLEFSRVGAETVAMRSLSAGAVVARTTRAAGPDAAATMPPAPPPPPDPGSGGPIVLPDATVIAPRPPTDQELAGDSIYQFIVHHATTPYPSNTAAVGSLTRWRGGRPETICPLTLGLSPAYNAFVSARLRAVAEKVGAPVQPDVNCEGNVRILFTSEPEKLMSAVYKWASSRLGVKYPNQPKKLLLKSSSHAIQGWYITAGRGGNILNTDAQQLGPLNLLPLWPLAIQTGLRGAGCCYGGIVSVIIVVNTPKVVGYTIGSIADYVSMAALTLVQSPDHCDPLPSILDLMAPSCSEREKPSGITAGDVAFLKALYFRNTGLGPSLSRSDIQGNMLRQFGGQ